MKAWRQWVTLGLLAAPELAVHAAGLVPGGVHGGVHGGVQIDGPLLAAAAGAALLLGALGAWWLRRLARQLRQRTLAERTLREMVNSLPGVVFQSVLGADGHLQQRFLSDAAESLLGPALPSAGSLPALILSRLPADQAAALRAAQAESLASGLPFAQTFCYAHPVHGPRWLRCEATVRPQPGGRTAWTGYLSDVSAEVALHARLLDAVQAKNLLVANVRHGLRAPDALAPTSEPPAPRAETAHPDAPAAPAPRSHSGPVLMVDDDPISRILLAEMLRRAGYAVLEADGAEQALDLWHQQRQPPVVAVISDRHMPGGDGPALLRQITEDALANHRPCPRRLLCTGDPDPTLADEVDLLLTKPVTVQLLTDALTSLGVMPGPPPVPGASSPG